MKFKYHFLRYTVQVSLVFILGVSVAVFYNKPNNYSSKSKK